MESPLRKPCACGSQSYQTFTEHSEGVVDTSQLTGEAKAAAGFIFASVRQVHVLLLPWCVKVTVMYSPPPHSNMLPAVHSTFPIHSKGILYKKQTILFLLIFCPSALPCKLLHDLSTPLITFDYTFCNFTQEFKDHCSGKTVKAGTVHIQNTGS